jgi:DNA-binding GntR family transcriptional regulator
MSLKVQDPKASGLTSSLYAQLREDILSGHFAVNAPLLETSLARDYGFSRTPVREALTLLEHDGLLQKAHPGFRVRSGTPQDVMEIYEARIALESAAAQNAAGRRTELDLIHLGHLQDRSVAATDPAETRDLHAEWHRRVWDAAKNSTITALMNRLMSQLSIYDQTLPLALDDFAITQGEHEEILRAIRDNDSTRAHESMTSHLTRSRDLRLQSLVVVG